MHQTSKVIFRPAPACLNCLRPRRRRHTPAAKLERIKQIVVSAQRRDLFSTSARDLVDQLDRVLSS